MHVRYFFLYIFFISEIFPLLTRMIGTFKQKCPTSKVCDILQTVRIISGEAHQNYIGVGMAERS